ncbi:MAG TPA: hypothetical protein VH054_11750 [Polyangiaceae bacterium]|nr:hypothetical protein [Polyangiaceae bacterium]
MKLQPLAASISFLLTMHCGARTELHDQESLDASMLVCGVADSGGGPCGKPIYGLTCCASTSMNLDNDPLNCGACGHACVAGEMCLHGACTPPTCKSPCGTCQVCCLVNTAGPAQPPRCVDGPTCPVGCPGCT